MSSVPVELVTSVREELIAGGAAEDAQSLHAAVRRRSGGLGTAATLELLRAVQAELTGAGPLAGLLADPTVTDVLVNGAEEVWVDRGQGLLRLPITFANDDEVRRLAVRLAAAAGRRLDTAVPFVDARLPGGVRMHAVLAPIAVSGACLSLRVHRQRPLTLEALVAAGSLHPDFEAVLRAMIEARLSFVVTGGAGSGKTTLLGALLARADPRERLVTVEDAAELHIDHPHVVRLEARPANVEGPGEVSVRELVRQALRMRPDRLIVGEARGAELLDMLLAANTGHDGAITTLHANGVADVPARIEALAMLAGVGRDAAHSLLASALRVAVHLHRGRDGKRRITEIALLPRDLSTGLVAAAPVLRWSGVEVGVGAMRREPGAARLGELLESRGTQAPAVLLGPS